MVEDKRYWYELGVLQAKVDRIEAEQDFQTKKLREMQKRIKRLNEENEKLNAECIRQIGIIHDLNGKNTVLEFALKVSGIDPTGLWEDEK